MIIVNNFFFQASSAIFYIRLKLPLTTTKNIKQNEIQKTNEDNSKLNFAKK